MAEPGRFRDRLLTLEFGLAGVGEESRAVPLARLLPGFAETPGEDAAGPRSGRVRMSLAEAGVYRDALLDLWGLAREGSGAALRLEDHPLGREGLKDVLVVLDCADACAASGLGAAYCTGVKDGWNWGCLHLRHVTPRPGPDGAGPDRPELRERLRQVAEERLLDLCPHFDLARTEALADAAPGSPQGASRPDLGGGRAWPGGEGGYPHRSGASPGVRVPSASYAEVGGLNAAVRELRETVELPLKRPDVLRRLGIPPHRGALLYGPPGCGKTLLARALAHESGAAFLAVSGPELITKWHGESEEKLRGLFAQARERQPSLVFFDEIDAIAQSRSSEESLRLDSRFTTQLLTLLDGVQDLGRVFVLAATNRMDLLDKALLRPGRLDRIIEIPRPDRAGCLAILRIHARGLPLARGVRLERLGPRLDGLTGADIAFLVREAAYACLRRSLDLDAVLAAPEALDPNTLEGLEVTAQDLARGLAAARTRTQALA